MDTVSQGMHCHLASWMRLLAHVTASTFRDPYLMRRKQSCGDQLRNFLQNAVAENQRAVERFAGINIPQG